MGQWYHLGSDRFGCGATETTREGVPAAAVEGDMDMFSTGEALVQLLLHLLQQHS
jgi:hypothetical protein